MFEGVCKQSESPGRINEKNLGTPGLNEEKGVILKAFAFINLSTNVSF